MLQYFPSFIDEMRKLAGLPAGVLPPPARMHNFLEGAGEEAGPASGAVVGAGLAKAYGFDPIAGAAAGYGLGSLPSIVKTVLKKKMAFAKSQYSGPLSYGPFKQESHIPPFNSPPVKTAGPPSEKTKQAGKVQGMAPTGTQTMGPQLQFSPTKQLNASRDVAEVETTKPSSKGTFHLSVKLPQVGSTPV